METGRKSFKFLIGKPTFKKSIEKPRRRYEDNIRMVYKEIDVNAKNLIDSA